MRFTKVATAGVGLAAAAAMTFSGSGGASALLLIPASFTHTQSLSDGTLTVKVNNNTSSSVKCNLSVHEASKETQVNLAVAKVNTHLAGGVSDTLLAAARQEVEADALKVVWTKKSISSNGSATATWKSGRADTSYVIYQDCSSDSLLGLTFSGLAQVYKVTGTGKSPDSPDAGNGSLGGLFGGLLG
ncbi:hypothetical protein [Gordonia alkanivorans]|uniref:hypothetical protein n=1 Tax=Gordonia alkanivorans TaxID=84096 RepID=UPI0024494153|nr:hypothetical protein [Gordonia alkanivorans]MDH3007151.1 hypothetical protein [Gordonia alkanivorans]MDH3017046.1 hypothetical protein [Gordonia alkanivorans]MDH3042207.1 hypothetical protein [Gordonia alkanivorans]MDH3061009.1 hypothetical protein [Gordonia alkanivorans]